MSCIHTVIHTHMLHTYCHIYTVSYIRTVIHSYSYTHILLLHAVSYIYTCRNVHTVIHIYSGQYDIICNHMGTETVLRALNWAHGTEWTRTYTIVYVVYSIAI